MVIRKPFFGYKQPLVDQGIPFFGSVGGKDADLAVVDFADVAAVLAGDSHGFVSLFDKAALIEDQDAIGASEIVIYKTTIFDFDICVIPRCFTDKPLQCPDISIFDGKGDWFNGFSFQRAELPNHVIEEMFSGLTALETSVKLFMKASEFAHEIFDITPSEIKFWNIV